MTSFQGHLDDVTTIIAGRNFVMDQYIVSDRCRMAVLFAGWLSEFVFVVLTFLFLYYLHFRFIGSKYWKNKNVAHLEPVFLFGNIWKASFLDSFTLMLVDFYRQWKGHKIIGFWNFRTPILLVNDLDIIKNVMTSDFSHFRDRGLEIDFHNDPLTGNLFNLGGAKWRNLRVKLTPTFTSGKMKMMFPTIINCSRVLQNYLAKLADSQEEVEVKEILARFGTDVISSCAFGIETNSMENPNSEFRKYGKKIFVPDFRALVSGLILNISPALFKLLKLRFTPKDVTEFFLNAVKETMEFREKNNVKRNDFMELLIQLKNKGKLDDVDGVIPSGLPEGELKAAEDMKFTFLEAAAQAFVFFAAGFETSSTTLSYALYELAINTDVQETLQQEIDLMLKENGGEMTYEAVHEAEYLDCVIQETLRKYPPVPILFRQCNKDYEIPGMGVVIPKKMPVMIPIMGIQRDHQYFPNPEKFDPRRFAPEEREKRHHFTFLPFGEGPRNCIGNRFGLMQTKVGLVSILSKFRVEMGKNTPIPLKFDKRSFVLSAEGGIPLKFIKRN